MFLTTEESLAKYFRDHRLLGSAQAVVDRIQDYRFKTSNMMSALTTHKQFHDDLPANVIEICIGFCIEMHYRNSNALEAFF